MLVTYIMDSIYSGTMFPSPCRVGSRTLPGSLLQVRLWKTLSSIIVLRRAALTVVGSHFATLIPASIVIFLLFQRWQGWTKSISSWGWKRRAVGYHRSRVGDTKYRANGIIDKRNIINSNRNTYRQISFRRRSCTAQDPPECSEDQQNFLRTTV